jgi:hypothetical protein
MTKKRTWYQWFSNPSQVLLIVFVGLCLFFTVGLFRQIDDLRVHQAKLRSALARRDGLIDTRRELDEYEANIELKLEGLVRDSYGARQEDTVVQIPPDYLAEVSVQPVWEPSDGPAWQQWWDLFFRRD